jgi:acetolactate synthase-1/3 small subunit
VHTISVLVENKFGVLARVAGMFSGRGFNIDSLNVAPTHDPSLSRITDRPQGRRRRARPGASSSCASSINVVEVVDFKEGPGRRARAHAGQGPKADGKTRPEILQIKRHLPRQDRQLVAHDSLIIEITGDEEKVAAFLGLLEPFGILELARTGRLALKR